MSDAEKETVDDGESGMGCGVCLPEKGTSIVDYLCGLGKYPWCYICTPSYPCKKGGLPAPFFYGKDDKLPLLLSLFLGFQHMIAMMAGIATSGGYLITNDACLAWQKDSMMCGRKSWMISCAWLTSGLLTIIQVFRAKICGTPFYLGTGLISVMGTSFTFLPIARAMTLDAIADAKDNWPQCEMTTAGSGEGSGFVATPILTGDCCAGNDCYGAGQHGYGKFLGTCLVGALLEIGFGLMPKAWIKKLFPPVVSGATVMLIGGGLLSAGMKYVGGGVFCGENAESRAAAGTAYSPGGPFFGGKGNTFLRDASNTFGTVGPQLCFGDNGDVVLGFGAPEYVGLAFSVIGMAIFLQFFGSPFFKSTFLFWGLCFGCAVAAVGKDVNDDGEPESYYRRDYIDNADGLTFLWKEGTYPIGFSGEYLLPILIGFFVSTAETVGDITVSAEYSKVTDPEDVASRVQGGLLADGLNSFLACLFGSPPNTTFSQNCGLIALTKTASRSVGFSCAFWLILIGIIAPFGAAFASIPICVVGGLVLVAFSSVFVSGMSVATRDWTRRNQFILTLALGVGLGVAMEGHVIAYPGPLAFYRKVLSFDYGFWPMKWICKTYLTSPGTGSGEVITHDRFCPNYNGPCCAEWDEGLKAARTFTLIILKTPYCIGFLFAFFLNLLLPEDAPDEETPKDAAATASSSTSSSA